MVERGPGLCFFSFIGGQGRWLSKKGLIVNGIALQMYLEKTERLAHSFTAGAVNRC